MSLSDAESGHSLRMIATLHTQSLASLDEVRAFLDGSAAVQFTAPEAAERHRLAGSHAAAVPLRDAQVCRQGPAAGVPAQRSATARARS